MSFYVYILASQRNGTLYIGQTDSLWRRVSDHRSKHIPGFTAKYGVTRLVYYEVFETREAARLRERRLKEWRRKWKLGLIEGRNPEWIDLFTDECVLDPPFPAADTLDPDVRRGDGSWDPGG